MTVADSVLKLCRDQRQGRVATWLLDIFGVEICFSREERINRFFEEAVELAQSVSMPKENALRIVEYVYNRPRGVPMQEIGGVSITLLALCHSYDISCDEAERQELERALSLDVDQLRAKHNAKADAGIARRTQ